MHALVKNGSIVKYPYTIGMLRKDNPNTSFPKKPTDEFLSGWNMERVAKVDRPNVDHTKNINEGSPQQINGVWTQVWEVTDASPEKITQRLEQMKAQAESQRAEAYRTESDPIFFKWQRGSATEQEWLDAVAAIKQRYPDPE